MRGAHTCCCQSSCCCASVESHADSRDSGAAAGIGGFRGLVPRSSRRRLDVPGGNQSGENSAAAAESPCGMATAAALAGLRSGLVAVLALPNPVHASWMSGRVEAYLMIKVSFCLGFPTNQYVAYGLRTVSFQHHCFAPWSE